MTRTKNKAKITITEKSDSFGDLEERKVTPEIQTQTQSIPLSKEALDQLDQPKLKTPELSWPQVIKEYIENYPNRTPDDIGDLIRKDYKLSIRRPFPNLAEKKKVQQQIISFNKAFNRAKNFKEGSIHFANALTNHSSNQKNQKPIVTPSVNSFNDFQEIWENSVNNEIIPQSQVSKRQKVGDQLEKKITKNVVNRLKVLIENRVLPECEDESHFSPSQFLKENPMVTLAKELGQTTEKAHETALAIEEYQKKTSDVNTLYEEKINALQKELKDKVALLDEAVAQLKEEHVKLLEKGNAITKQLAESIDVTNKHYS